MFHSCNFFKSITSIAQFSTDFFNDPAFRKKCFAVVGRSNVGKSSLINTLTNKKNIAHISKQPGKTRAINFFVIDDKIILADLPGYGYAKRSKTEINNWGKIIDKFFITRKDNINHVFSLIDSRFIPKDSDIEVFRYFSDIGIDFSIILTKIDKSNRETIEICTKRLSEILRHSHSFSGNVFFSSAKNPKSFDDIKKFIYDV